MDRKCEHGRVILKNSRCAIAMVHVRVDYDRFFDRTVGLQLPNRHRHVVNRTESLAVPRMSVMKAAA